MTGRLKTGEGSAGTVHEMNPKLVKERTRTKAQRPDIVVAYENLLRQRAAERKHDTRIAHCDKSIEQRRSA